MDLSRKRERERLPARREPYWMRLASGAYLGFRRGPDTWIARFRGRDGGQQYKALDGVIDYDEAKRVGEQWMSQLAGSTVRTLKRGTVKEALADYLMHLASQGRGEAAAAIKKRFELVVYEDPVAEVQLESATRDDFSDWRARISEGRQPRTINRYVRAVVAALNLAHAELGHLGNPKAWTLTPLSDEVEEEGATAVFLSPAQRRAAIDASDAYLGRFLRALECTGARPKEMASALVKDFDGQRLRLAHKKGRPPRLRARHVVLDKDAVIFFEEQARDKLPTASLFTRDGVSPWDRHAWSKRFRAAVDEANKKLKGKSRIPVAAGAYSFRHARISELLQVFDIDPLTVASQTGTSLQMIERSYYRFIASAMREKLESLKQDVKASV